MKYCKIIKLTSIVIIFLILLAYGVINNYGNRYTVRGNINEHNNLYNYIEETNLTQTENDMLLIDNLYGSWLLDEVVFWDTINALKKERPIVSESKYIGSVFEYQKDYFKINDICYEKPLYNIELVDDAYLRFDRTRQFFEFIDKYDVNTNNMKYVDITVNGEKPDLGLRLYLIDKDHILLDGFSLFIVAKRVNTEELKKEDIPKPPENPNPEYIYGKWKIIDKYAVKTNSQYYKDGLHFNPEVITDIGSEYIGQVFEYQKNYCVFNDITYNNPVYAYDVSLGDTSMSEMMSFDWNFKPIICIYNLNNESTLFNYIQQSIIFENENVENLGCEPCYVNENYIVFLMWAEESKYDIFFIAKKID